MARLIDLYVAWVLVYSIGFRVIPALRHEPGIFLGIIAGAIWMFIEALLLSIVGTTPGKWLLRMRVERAAAGAGSYLSLLDRSFTVFSWGLGCMVPGLNVVCPAIAYQDLKSCGTTRWDRGRFYVAHGSLGAGRIAAAVLAALVLVVCASLVGSGG